MNRGSLAGQERLVFDDLASMRPRFMNRGSARTTEAWCPDAKASMRPRFMNRGSTVDIRVTGSTPAGFNEAPIHESGKSADSPVAKAAKAELQ